MAKGVSFLSSKLMVHKKGIHMGQSSYYGSFLCRVGVAGRAPSLLQPVMVHKKDGHLIMDLFYVEWVWLKE